MKSRTRLCLAFIALGAVGTAGSVDLKTFLDLSDAQIQGIAQGQQQLQQAVQPVVQQIQQRQQVLQQLLRSEAPDVAAIGRLTVEIGAISKQLQQVLEGARARLADALSAEQRSKLETLQQVLVLSPAAAQAVSLGLIGPPSP